MRSAAAIDLLLLRHGIASDIGVDGCRTDAERPLTAEGRRKLEDVGRFLVAAGVEPEVIAHSPLVRAEQTAKLVAGYLKQAGPFAVVDCLKPERPPADAVKYLRSLPAGTRCVLCVGHEPNLSSLAAWLISGSTESRIELKKGGLIRIDLQPDGAGFHGVLRHVITPRLAGLLRGD